MIEREERLIDIEQRSLELSMTDENHMSVDINWLTTQLRSAWARERTLKEVVELCSNVFGNLMYSGPKGFTKEERDKELKEYHHNVRFGDIAREALSKIEGL